MMTVFEAKLKGYFWPLHSTQSVWFRRAECAVATWPLHASLAFLPPLERKHCVLAFHVTLAFRSNQFSTQESSVAGLTLDRTTASPVIHRVDSGLSSDALLRSSFGPCIISLRIHPLPTERAFLISPASPYLPYILDPTSFSSCTIPMSSPFHPSRFHSTSTPHLVLVWLASCALHIIPLRCNLLVYWSDWIKCLLITCRPCHR